MKKRSLAELDQVVNEILERNPDFLDKLEKIIKKSLTEKKQDYNGKL